MGSRKTEESGDANQTLLIGDDLLTEILTRIPTPVVAIRCKLVCKRWCSLISSHYFIRRFKQQHIKHPKPLSGMLANTHSRVKISDSGFNFRGFNLDYLPEKNEKIKALASCDDLIICKARKNESSECSYYLCNPFTVQWAAVPPPPPPPRPRWRCYRTGLVCKPYNGGGDRFRHRIVHFYKESDPSRQEILYHAVIYCSETGEWIRCDDRGKEYWVASKSIAAYNGKLHWVNKYGEYLVTLDPFDMRQTSTRLTVNHSWRGDHYHVGEWEGVLRVVRIEIGLEQAQMTSKGITVWELQEDEHDEDASRLILKDHIVLSDLTHAIDNVEFHPRNKDVLLRSQDLLSSFNTKTRELKAETRFKGHYGYRYLFTLQLPWWPTPIPSQSFSHINDIQLEGSEPS